MATAAEQARRNEEICSAHAAGETVAALVTSFKLSKSRINEIVSAGKPLLKGPISGIQLAEERLTAYRDLLAEVRGLATAISEIQPAAKVGAYRLIFDVLGHLTSLEQKLGYLPSDLAGLGHEREFAETINGIITAPKVPAEVRQAVLDALEDARWQV